LAGARGCTWRVEQFIGTDCVVLFGDRKREGVVKTNKDSNVAQKFEFVVVPTKFRKCTIVR
jgi:hypothetical protein